MVSPIAERLAQLSDAKGILIASMGQLLRPRPTDNIQALLVLLHAYAFLHAQSLQLLGVKI